MPGPDLRVTPDEVREKGWPRLFAADTRGDRPLVVEIGFGRGEFLAYLAAEQPEQAHVGVELSWKRVLKMARRTAKSELRNLRLIHGDANEVVATAFGDATVGTFWVNFPDPWPKRRHLGRRLVQRGFLDLLVSKLVPGGLLEIATDHVRYARWIDQRLRGTPGVENLLAPDGFRNEIPGRFCTAYEALWRAEQRALHFWRYRRTPE